jgi:HlyD family secretion protein
MSPSGYSAPPRASRRGLGYVLIIIFTMVLLLVTAAGVMLGRGGAAEGSGVADRFEVRRGGFDITIPASGELAALKQIEVSSQLEARAVITEIVDEGQWVEAGDVLIRLDDEDILNRIKDAEVAVKNAETTWTTAQSNLEIRQDSSESQLTLADTDIKLAELSLKAWHEGTDLSQRQQLDLEVETTEKDYLRLVARHEASGDLLEQEFISQDEYDRSEIDMIKARSKFEQAKLARKVYLEIVQEKDREGLQAAVKKAKDYKQEISQRNANEIMQLETSVENRLVALNRERERLAKARDQFERCTIRAPQAGLVVYTTSVQTGRHGRNDEQPPQVGTELRRNRPVIILPDTSRMVAEVKINEAVSGKIKPGQRAVVFSDANPDVPLSGEVQSVGVLAESGGWRDPNRRDYTVRLALQGANELGLKPSMRCRASIYVGHVDDALYVPVQAVFHDGAVAYAYVPDGGSFAQRAVNVGRSSDMYTEIIDGLGVGETVLLHEPPPERIASRLEVERGTGGQGPGGPGAKARRGGGGEGRPERGGQGRGGRERHGSGRPAGAKPASGTSS